MTLRSLAKDQSCIRCGANDGTVVGAHYTGIRRGAYGGGLGKKAHDICIAHLCMGCHTLMDYGSRCKDEKWLHSEEFQHLILLTLIRLWKQGKIGLL